MLGYIRVFRRDVALQRLKFSEFDHKLDVALQRLKFSEFDHNQDVAVQRLYINPE